MTSIYNLIKDLDIPPDLFEGKAYAHKIIFTQKRIAKDKNLRDKMSKAKEQILNI